MQTCVACGQENPEGFKFCGACAAPLSTAAAASREERKVITVLFADLVGFTSRAERLDPEDVRALLSPYYARLRHELERHGGTVEKFIGDAVVALFGAPIGARGRSGAGGAGCARDPRGDRRAERSRSDARARGADRGQHGRSARRARCSPGARRGHGVGRRRQHGGAPAVGGARSTASSSARRRTGRPDGDRVSRGRAGRGEGKVAAGCRVGGAPRPRSLRARRRPAPAGRAWSGASSELELLARPSSGSRKRPQPAARDARRRAGDRQEPSDRGAVPGRRRRPRPDPLAPGSLAALR